MNYLYDLTINKIYQQNFIYLIIHANISKIYLRRLDEKNFTFRSRLLHVVS